MNQTNGVSGSSKAIRSQPNSKIQQPGTPPSAKHPIKKTLDKPLPKPEPDLTLDEAEELLRNCQECAKAVNGTAKAFRRAVCEAYVQGALKVLKVNDAGFRQEVSMGVTGNRHRSTINRLCLAGKMDAKYKLPPGAVNEYALRTCRTKVPEDKWGAVLAHAKKKMGLYGKIEAPTIEAAARELGCLKPRADHPSPAKGGESVGDGEENRESQNTSNQQQKAATKTRSNVTETREEAVRVWLEKLMNLQLGLEKLLKKHGIQPAQIQKVVTLVKHQRQQLNDLLKKAIG